MSWRGVLLAALLCLPVVAALALGLAATPKDSPSLLAGKPAPGCVLRDLNGKEASFVPASDRPLLLSFWSTWCAPCEAEHALLQRMAKTYADRVRFVGIVYQDTPENARAYLAQRGKAYEQLLDSNSACAIDYGVVGVPETFFIDSQGTVRAHHAGPLSAAVIADAFAGLGVHP